MAPAAPVTATRIGAMLMNSKARMMDAARALASNYAISESALRFQPKQLDRLRPQFCPVAIARGVNVPEPVGVVGVGKILAVMRAPAVLAQERAAGDQFGSHQHVPQVERLLPGQVESPSTGRRNRFQPLLQV